MALLSFSWHANDALNKARKEFVFRLLLHKKDMPLGCYGKKIPTHK